MGWTWRYQNSDGLVITPDGALEPEVSPTQGDAETWLGESWRELAEAGVEAVVLLEDGREIYGPMSLQAE